MPRRASLRWLSAVFPQRVAAGMEEEGLIVFFARGSNLEVDTTGCDSRTLQQALTCIVENCGLGDYAVDIYSD